MFCSKTAIPAAVFQSLCKGGKLRRAYSSRATLLHLSKRRAQPSNTQLITITEDKKHLLAECYLTHLKAEPINNTVGYDTVRDRNEYMRIFTERIYRCNSPQIAVWNYQMQKVVGMQLTKLCSTNQHLCHNSTEEHYLADAKVPGHIKIRTKIMDDYYSSIENQYSNPRAHGVNRTIYLNSLVVDANHQRQGLATKLVEEAVRQCQQSLDINVFVSVCTSATSLKILKSVGFDEIYTESYDGNYPGYNWLSQDLQKQYDRLWVVIKRTD